DKRLRKAVREVGLGRGARLLLVSVPRFVLGRMKRALDVVPEELHRLHTDRPQLLALREELLELAIVRVPDRKPGRDRVDELDAMRVCSADELRQLCKLLLGVWLAPELAMVRIVLRRVHPHVESLGGGKADQV